MTTEHQGNSNEDYNSIPYTCLLPKQQLLGYMQKTLDLIPVHHKLLKSYIFPSFYCSIDTVAKIWKQPKCPLVGAFDKENKIYICNRILFNC